MHIGLKQKTRKSEHAHSILIVRNVIGFVYSVIRK